MYPESSDDSGREGEGVRKILSPYKKKNLSLASRENIIHGQTPTETRAPTSLTGI